jgi:YidC/Oxa1 family membrane protein insertase
MDSKRLIIFIALSFSILLLWQEYFAPKPVAKPAVTQQASTAASNSDTPAASASNVAQPADSSLIRGQRITVTTYLVKAEIDTTGGICAPATAQAQCGGRRQQAVELFTDKGAHRTWHRPVWSPPAMPRCRPTDRIHAERPPTLQGDKVEIADRAGSQWRPGEQGVHLPQGQLPDRCALRHRQRRHHAADQHRLLPPAA